jgi:hypothetical protein
MSDNRLILTDNRLQDKADFVKILKKVEKRPTPSSKDDNTGGTDAEIEA